MAKTKGDERSANGTISAGKEAGRSAEAEIAPSTSLMFMDAANNIAVKDFTKDNVRKYTLHKYNVDVTENMFANMSNMKPTTRADIRAEQRRIDASKQSGIESTPMGSTKAKRKFEPTLGSPVGGTKKKNIDHEKIIIPASLEGQESLIVQKEAGDNAAPVEESKMAKTEKSKAKGSSEKNVKNTIISSKKVKSKSQVDETKKKSVGRVKTTPVSLEGPESLDVQVEQVGEKAGNSKNDSKMAKTEKSKAKESSKKNVKKTVVSGKKVKSKSQVDGTKKKSVGRAKTTPVSLKTAQSHDVQKEQKESKKTKTEKSKAKGSSKKNVKKTVVPEKKVKSKSQVDGTKKKSVGRVKTTPVSLKRAQSHDVQKEQKESKKAKTEKSKAKGSSKKNVKKTVVSGKKGKTTKA